MGMASATNVWTAERIRELPDDGRRYEVVAGELFVTPAPAWRHQRAVRELTRALAAYLEQDTLAEVLPSPADVEFDQFNMVEPDLFVVPLVSGRRPRDFEEAGRLLLAIEVLSPGTARADREVKRRLYQKQSVEYWIINLDARVVERWRAHAAQPEIIATKLEWRPEGASETFELELPSYFATIE